MIKLTLARSPLARTHARLLARALAHLEHLSYERIKLVGNAQTKSLIRSWIHDRRQVFRKSQASEPSVNLSDKGLVLLDVDGGGNGALVWRCHEPEPHLCHTFAYWSECWRRGPAIFWHTNEPKHCTRVSALCNGRCLTGSSRRTLLAHSFVYEGVIVSASTTQTYPHAHTHLRPPSTR